MIDLNSFPSAASITTKSGTGLETKRERRNKLLQGSEESAGEQRLPVTCGNLCHKRSSA